jgi:hypothetical protein
VQSSGVEHNHVVEALTTDRADEPLYVGVLPRRARRGAHVLNAHRLCRPDERLKRQVPVVNEIARRLIPRECVTELLRRPGGTGTRRHGEMNDSAALVREDDEHEQ